MLDKMIRMATNRFDTKQVFYVAYATRGGKLVQKSDGKPDLRVRRTRLLLVQAMMDLTVERGYAEITVQDIAERAMVNRSTFYRHFLDKDDLLNQCLDETFAVVKVPEQPGPEGAPIPLIRLIEQVQAHGEFFRVMLGEHGDPTFAERFRKAAEERYRYILSVRGSKTGADLPPIDLRLTYATYAGLCGISWWLENDQPCTPEVLANWISQLSTTSIGLA